MRREEVIEFGGVGEVVLWKNINFSMGLVIFLEVFFRKGGGDMVVVGLKEGFWEKFNDDSF